jgi:hypothetical protein
MLTIHMTGGYSAVSLTAKTNTAFLSSISSLCLWTKVLKFMDLIKLGSSKQRIGNQSV